MVTSDQSPAHPGTIQYMYIVDVFLADRNKSHGMVSDLDRKVRIRITTPRHFPIWRHYIPSLHSPRTVNMINACKGRIPWGGGMSNPLPPTTLTRSLRRITMQIIIVLIVGFLSFWIQEVEIRFILDKCHVRYASICIIYLIFSLENHPVSTKLVFIFFEG